MEIIDKYFPGLTDRQRTQFAALEGLYGEWNNRINVISRKDMEQLYMHHVLHSLSVAKICEFAPEARILDVGSGGGFPGIPLAILFPESRFTLVDSIAKKVKVMAAVSESLGLSNVTALKIRAEDSKGKFDYVVSRAVTEMKTFTDWVWNKIERGQHGSLPNGILSLKGGDLIEELAAVGKNYAIYDIYRYFPEEFFETKKVVYIKK